MSLAPLRSVEQYFGPSVQHHPAEARPVLVVVVDDEAHARVLGNVLEPFQLPWAPPLGLAIDGDVERRTGDRIADGNHMGHSLPVRRREMCDALGLDEPPCVLAEHLTPSAPLASCPDLTQSSAQCPLLRRPAKVAPGEII
jgi:hypothetical protein